MARAKAGKLLVCLGHLLMRLDHYLVVVALDPPGESLAIKGIPGLFLNQGTFNDSGTNCTKHICRR